MLTKIIKIGNSRGIRIPNPILKESGIENEVELKVSDFGITIKPVKKTIAKFTENSLLSEAVLATDWNRPEEDLAWKNI